MARRRGSLLLPLVLSTACARSMAASGEPVPPAAASESASRALDGGAPVTTGSARTSTLAPESPSANGQRSSEPATAPSATSGAGSRRCREQGALPFLLRQAYLAKIGASAQERAQILAARERAAAFRTTAYGYFPGFGRRDQNPHPPRYYARPTRFMGLPVTLHEKVIPALACVERALRMECSETPYQPRRVNGLREQNTFIDYEVSSHVYGIAIDIDPDKNPCCRCIGKWSQSPLCEKKVSSVFERMAMPECWVTIFERYGFRWLGRDELEDTMHFEFLGDPERILE